MADVLLYLETAQGADGASLKKPAAEVATAGRALAGDGRLVALVTGPVAPEGTLGRHGVDEVLHVDGDAYAHHLLEAQAAALEAAIADVQPATVLLAATVLGKELAAYVAGRTDRALISDAVAVHAEGAAIVATKPKFAGKATATLAVTGPSIVSLRPNAVAPAEAPRPRSASTPRR